MARRSATIDSLEQHPNLDEVLGVLARLAQVGDADLPRLAQAWSNNATVATARDRALGPDSPLVLEVLAAFEAVSALFEDDVRGEASFLTVDPPVVTLALKAVRDAIAAAYARPVLSRAQHAALMRPWRAVYAAGQVVEPDLGPQAAQVKALLAALPRLAERCHDAEGRELFEGLVDQSFVGESERAEARAEAFQAAVLTSRRRLWALVRRSGAEGLNRACQPCHTFHRERPGHAGRPGNREAERVLGLCLDAVCALLVADALPDALTDLLTRPVTALVPVQRRPV